MTAVDPVSQLHDALGAEMLRASLLRSGPPRLADRYAVTRILGRGASGLVVAAEDVRLVRAVALKLTMAAAATDDANLAEARALAKLDHPNVVRVLNAEVTIARLDGRDLALRITSMPHVEGTSLRAWLREKHRTTREIVEVFAQAGAGLAAAHEQRIVHRDFKPENVIVRIDGVAQVIDFGLALPHDSSTPVASQVAGTAPYLAPEVQKGHVGPRCDQYAFGISLVEALTGAPVPPEPRPPAGIAPRIWAVAVRATHPNPRRRFRDMNAVIAALRSAAKRRWGCGMWAFAALTSSCLLCLGLWPASWLYGEIRCGPFAGEWEFRTHVDVTDDPDRMPAGTEGIYRLTLTHRHYCLFEAHLDHTGDDGPLGSHSYHRETRWRWPNALLLLPGTPTELDIGPPSDPERLAMYHLRFSGDRRIEGGDFERTSSPRYSGRILPADR
jgi:serine/threonine protein kinase